MAFSRQPWHVCVVRPKEHINMDRYWCHAGPGEVPPAGIIRFSTRQLIFLSYFPINAWQTGAQDLGLRVSSLITPTDAPPIFSKNSPKKRRNCALFTIPRNLICSLPDLTPTLYKRPEISSSLSINKGQSTFRIEGRGINCRLELQCDSLFPTNVAK